MLCSSEQSKRGSTWVVAGAGWVAWGCTHGESNKAAAVVGMHGCHMVAQGAQ